MGMTKTEFVAALASRAQMTPAYADRILNATLAAIEDALYRDGRIALPGLGVFDILTRKARTCRNPATQDAVEVPESRTVRFKPAKNLKEMLN